MDQGPARQWHKPVGPNNGQVARLLAVFNDAKAVRHPDAWRVRMLLASHGLRRSDAENLLPCCFDPADMTVRTKEKKTGKWTKRPLNPDLWPHIWNYVSKLEPTTPRLIPDIVTSKKWKRICKAAGLPYGEVRFHDTRVTFTSELAANDVPTGVAQKLLNHSTARLTNEVYTDFDPTLRPAINRLPGKAWTKNITQEDVADQDVTKPPQDTSEAEAA
jgi:integrase